MATKPAPVPEKPLPENPAPKTAGSERLDKYREKLIELVALGLPTLLIQGLFKPLADRFLNQPWQALWLIAPLAAVAWIAWQAARGHADLKLRGPVLVFFVAFVSCFSLAASSSLLDWNRKATVFGTPVPRSWLAPNWTGDWRYRLAPKTPMQPNDIILVMMQPPAGATLDARQARLQISSLIRLASVNGSRGFILDFLFRQDTEMDPVLCATIQSAGIPVLMPFPFARSEEDFVRLPAAKALERCVPPDAWGHPVGFLDLDRTVRFLPLYFRHQQDLPALSLRAAAILSGGAVVVPAGGLLQLVEPAGKIPQVDFETLVRDKDSRARLRDRFVFVGESSARDSFETPFGRRSGIWIHAAAASSLRHHHYFERSPWWASLGLLFVACYLLLSRAVRGDSALRLAAFCGVASAAILGLAVLAAWRLLWLDVVYPLAALWLLLALVPGVRHLPMPG